MKISSIFHPLLKTVFIQKKGETNQPATRKDTIAFFTQLDFGGLAQDSAEEISSIKVLSFTIPGSILRREIVLAGIKDFSQWTNYFREFANWSDSFENIKIKIPRWDSMIGSSFV